ncbi:MAG TPA: ABC transporter ATP-binding protein [Dehalococcoidia bacterium]|jgi:NitT/TauT family transport system ATP-binding protein|nr:ABC transporter ATP-binding protein [Dehalococcoidia bacterium]
MALDTFETVGEAPPATAPPAGGTLLSLTNITRHFRSRRHNTLALDDVSLFVSESEFVCVVGPSGCGKSTLLNIVAGLDKPTSGEASFDGRRIDKPGRDRFVVFQEPALYPWLNVRANVEMGLRIAGRGAKERRQLADRYLALVNLRKFERAYIHELSGGMKQRAQLARALAVEPRMLLMDEPFAALDAQTRDVLQQELQEITARLRTTVIFITHNVREAVILGDRVVVMTPAPGRIKTELRVDLPRPRGPDAHSVVDLSARIRAELEHDIYAGQAQEDTYAI